MLLLPETLLTSIKQRQTITSHDTNRHFYACVGQPLSKQLYVERQNQEAGGKNSKYVKT